MAKFTKETASENGRKGGKALSKKNTAFKNLKEYLLDGGSDRFREELEELHGKDYIDAFIKILEYAKPKLARQEIKEESTQTINWSETKTYESK